LTTGAQLANLPYKADSKVSGIGRFLVLNAPAKRSVALFQEGAEN